MAVKHYRPHTPSRRFMTGYSFDEITKTTPEKSLTKGVARASWRNNSGRITSRFKGGGHKRRYRTVDFRRYDKEGIPAKVASIEYDPFRTSRIVLVNYADGEKRYHIAWKGASVWDVVLTWEAGPIAPGNRKKLKDIPDGLTIYNLEIIPQTKGKLIKSAWLSASIMGKDDVQWLVFVRMPSWEIRKFNEKCWATIGIVGNDEHKNIVIWKAGRQRWLWRKPRNRGKSMNPVDHPHGGWEGATSIGMKYPKAFNGRIVAPWKKTRSKKKWSDKFIISRRTKN